MQAGVVLNVGHHTQYQVGVGRRQEILGELFVAVPAAVGIAKTPKQVGKKLAVVHAVDPGLAYYGIDEAFCLIMNVERQPTVTDAYF